MRDTFPFLTHLGLDTSADTRDIRRAYARQLKQIDQEKDPAAFQKLRSAYEIALHWAEHASEYEDEDDMPAQAEALADNPEPPPPPIPPPPPPPSPQVDTSREEAEIAFSAFLAATATQRKIASPDAVSDLAAALRKTLAREALHNLAVRNAFEARLVGYLLEGWQPGNENLLPAALQVFGWESNRLHVDMFGYQGNAMNRALDEYLTLEARGEPDRSNQRRTLRHLRTNEIPANHIVLRDMVHAERMMQRYPVVMPMIVSMEVLEAWRARHRQLAASDADTAPKPVPEIKSTYEWKQKGSMVFVVMLLIQGIRMLFDHNAVPHTPGIPLATVQRTTDPNTLPRLGVEQSIEMAKRVRYKLAPAQTRRSIFIVSLGGAGGVNIVTLSKSSGDSGFDNAVNQAIRDTPPFGPEAPRMFVVDIVKTGDFAPGETMPVPPPVKQVSKAMLDEIARRINFVAPHGMEPGHLEVKFEVLIDAKGAFGEVSLLKASYEPYYDKAVERAIRQTKPLGPGYAGKHILTYGVTYGPKASTPPPG